MKIILSQANFAKFYIFFKEKKNVFYSFAKAVQFIDMCWFNMVDIHSLWLVARAYSVRGMGWRDVGVPSCDNVFSIFFILRRRAAAGPSPRSFKG